MVAEFRQAREQSALIRRRLLPIGLLALALVVSISARGKPGIGMHGALLALLLTIIGFIVGFLGVRRSRILRGVSGPSYRPMFALLLVSSAALEWVQPTRPGVGGCVMAVLVAVTARAIPARLVIAFPASTALYSGPVLSDVIGSDVHHQKWPSQAASLVPFAGVFLAAAVVWRFRKKEEQASRLLRQIEETRDAEPQAISYAYRHGITGA